MIQQVLEFNKKFDLPTGGVDVISNKPDVALYRLGFLDEELQELRVAFRDKDRVGAFDALLDLVYVAHGTALFMGISPEQWDDGMRAVHSANMAKKRVEGIGQSKRKSSLDVHKPLGWVGPEVTLERILTELAPNRSAQDGDLRDGALSGTYEEEDIKNIPTNVLLEELEKRGGHPGALAQAALLSIRKGGDYSYGKDRDLHHIDRSEYFPFGDASYAQMINTKSQRFIALVRKSQDEGKINFEGLMDTALDIINYAGFYLASMEDRNE